MQFVLTPSHMMGDELIPTHTRLAGYAALIAALHLEAPLRSYTCIANGHIKKGTRKDGHWKVYDKRYWPGESLGDHLAFALKHEPIDLLILKRTFDAAEPVDIQTFVTSSPTGAPNRRIWFLYEMLTGKTLDIEDTGRIPNIDLLNPKDYFTGTPKHLASWRAD